MHSVAGVDPDHVFDLLGHPLRLRRREIDFIEDRHNLVVRVNRLVNICKRLRLDALAGVHDQQRSFDRQHRSGNLVGEVHMPWRVDQVENVIFAVLGIIAQTNRLRLDRDATLSLEIHRVEHLRFHLAV